MAIKRVEHVDLPYAGRRHTPDNSRLSALYSRGGDVLADIALRKGENAARMYGQLAGLFTNFQETGRQQKATAAATAMREAEREQDRKEREAERKAREAERAAVQAEKSALTAERKGAAVAAEVGSGPMSETQLEDVLQGPSAGRARYAFGPGTAEGPELMPTAEQQRALTAEGDIRKLGGTIGPNGQVVMPQKPIATKALKMEPAMVGGKRTFVVFDPETGAATDFRGQPVDAQPIPPQSATGDNEPLATIIGPDGKPIYVRRSDAIGKSPTSGSEKPSSGVQKRMLGFFNRAQQADVDLEGLEEDVRKMDLAGQTYMNWAPNFAQTSLGQRYTQAQRAFTEARLRKDSGAAIPTQEFDNDRKTYFVQPGDDDATQDQKRRARGAMLASMGFESGQALGEFLGNAEEAAAMVQSYKDRAADPKAPLKPGTTVKVGGFTVREKP